MAWARSSWVPRDYARVSCREFGCGKLHASWLEVGSDGTGSRRGGGSGQRAIKPHCRPNLTLLPALLLTSD